MYRIAFRRLSRHPCQHDCFLRRYPKIPRRLQRAPDIGIFRAAIESNQVHTVRALHLIAVAESLRPLAERLAASGTQNLDPVGHEILRKEMISLSFRILLIRYLNLETLFPALQRRDPERKSRRRRPICWKHRMAISIKGEAAINIERERQKEYRGRLVGLPKASFRASIGVCKKRQPAKHVR